MFLIVISTHEDTTLLNNKSIKSILYFIYLLIYLFIFIYFAWFILFTED